MRVLRNHETMYLSHPLVLNIELTDLCPLNCPYCYKDLSQTNEIDFSVLVNTINTFKKNGGSYILLSGGEPLLYTRLIDVIHTCSELSLKTALSTSGFGLKRDLLRQIIDAGLNDLFISLNSTDKAINACSRDGYEYAMEAINLCESVGISFKLNTVVRKENLPHLEDLIQYAKEKGAKGIDLLMNKPDSNGETEGVLGYKDLKHVIYLLDQYKGFLEYQNCFIPLKSYYNMLCSSRMLNPLLRGCPAGKYSMAMFSDGTYAACPHSNYRDSGKDIEEFWNRSEEIMQYRSINKSTNNYCSSCKYTEYCSPCITFEAYKNCWSEYGRESVE